MHKSDTFLKIISLLAAILIWLYVMGEVDPETRAKVGEIPVYLSGTEVLEESELAAAYDKQIFISATISGKRSDVNEAKKNGLTAYVDVAECEEGKSEQKIVINLPDGIKLENSSRSTMKVDVEPLVSETKKVTIGFSEPSAGEAASDATPWVLEQYPDEVEVSGAESSVAKVRQVEGFISANEALRDKSKRVSVELTPVNGKGRALYGLSLSIENAEAEIQALYVNNVNVELVKENYDTETDETDEIDLDKIDVPDKIGLIGPADTIRELDSVQGIVSVGEDGKVSVRLVLPKKIFVFIGEDKWEDYLEPTE